MYSSQTENGNTSLKLADYAQIDKKYKSAQYNEILGIIHIVNYNALDRYLDLVKKYYWSHSQYILDNQEMLLDSVKGNLVNWRDFRTF